MTKPSPKYEKMSNLDQRRLAREVKEGRDATVQTSRWDRYLAAREVEDGGSFAQAASVHDDSPAWHAYARETFSKLYDSGASSDLPDDQRPRGSEWVQKLHQAAEALPEWRALRERARRDPWAAGLAAGEALNVVAQTVEPPKSDPQAIQDELDLVKSFMEEGNGKTSPKHLRKMSSLKKQLQEAEIEQSRAVQALGARDAAVRSAMRAAANKAQEQINEMDEAGAALGQGGGTGLASVVAAPPVKLRSALLRNAKLRNIAKLAGRMRAAAVQKQRTKARPGSEELCDVRSGSDLARLLPVELANLAEEDTEAMLYRRVLEGSALQYELQGKEHRAEGPIIMAVDESGSMSGVPDTWAKAVAMALMEIAARQNRPFAYVHFDTRVTRVDAFEKPKSLSLEDLEQLCVYFTGGGTAIRTALNHCAGMLEKKADERDKPWTRADVVLVTDGIDYDDAGHVAECERIKKIGGHVYGIFIGTEPGAGLKKVLDEKISLSSEDVRSGDPRRLGELFAM